MSDSNQNYPKSTISYGKDYNFYKELTLSNSTYYDFPINGGADGYECHVLSTVVGHIMQIKFTVSDGADIYVSFNGNTDHAHLVGDTGFRKEYIYPFLQKTKFWFRGSGYIEIEYYVS